jgi:hypothetical protein
MDDLKLISTTDKELKKQIQTVRTFSDDIHMEFRLNKCPETVLKKEKLVRSQNLMLDINREIEEQGETCKYLWTDGSYDIHHQQMKDRLKNEYTMRLQILKYQLNAKNRITVTGELTVLELSYSSSISN